MRKGYSYIFFKRGAAADASNKLEDPLLNAVLEVSPRLRSHSNSPWFDTRVRTAVSLQDSAALVENPRTEKKIGIMMHFAYA